MVSEYLAERYSFLRITIHVTHDVAKQFSPPPLDE